MPLREPLMLHAFMPMLTSLKPQIVKQPSMLCTHMLQIAMPLGMVPL